jgi:TonB family protein
LLPLAQAWQAKRKLPTVARSAHFSDVSVSNPGMPRIIASTIIVLIAAQQSSPPRQPECTSKQTTRVWTAIKPAVVKTRVEPSWPFPGTNDTRGVIILDVWIDEKGNVSCVEVTRSIPINDRAAVAAVRQWTFVPATLRGQPIAVVQEVRLEKRFGL